MSLPPSPASIIPEGTCRVARAAFPKGNVFMRRRDALGLISSAPPFASLCSQTGQPAQAPARLALVLQFAEGLAGRQAADAVRSRLDWPYALGLALTDPGFDDSVLREFRPRLIAGGGEHLLLETMPTYLQERGLLKARGQQRTDSAPILAAIRTLNRLAWVGETMRFALNRLAAVAPAWVQTQRQPGWRARYGARGEHYRLPRTEAERQRLAATIGADGFALLPAVFAPETPLEVRAEPAVEVLRRIWGRRYAGPDDPPRWRQDGEVPPSPRVIHAPDALEARSSLKRGMARIGYRVPVTETCDADTPQVITQVETTLATAPDDQMLDTIHAALAEHALLPHEPLVDCGDTDAEILVGSEREDGVAIVGPVAADPSWQAREATGFANRAFTIDGEPHTATCPQGKQRRKWQPDTDVAGQDVVHIRLAKTAGQACAVRVACPRAKAEPRPLTVRTEGDQEVRQAARQRQTTVEFQEHDAKRAGIEGTLSQGVRALDRRRSRSMGLATTPLQHILSAAAINLVRVVAWLTDPRPPKRRAAPLAALASAA